MARRRIRVASNPSSLVEMVHPFSRGGEPWPENLRNDWKAWP